MHNYGITPTNTGLGFASGAIILGNLIYIALIGLVLYGGYYLLWKL